MTMPRSSRAAIAVWAALVVPVYMVCVLCTHWEPVMLDGWGHFANHRHNDVHPWLFAKAAYLGGNPRFGQVLTYLLYTPGPWHVLITPVVELGMFYLLAALALGRWPQLRQFDDALVFAAVVMLVLAAGPAFGQMLFYRPYTGNYLYGLVITLALLLPYRFFAERARPRRSWPVEIVLASAMLVLGLVTGMCNEHTGPTVLAIIGFAIVAFVRRGDRLRPWMLAGAVGMLAGGLALYFAPGQDIRYSGLAKQPLLDVIGDRGIGGNLRVVFGTFGYASPAAVALALGWFARRSGGAEPISRPRVWTIYVALAAAMLISLTLLVSPKQGPRLHFAPVIAICVALASWLVPQLRVRWSRIVFGVLVAGVVCFVSERLLVSYATLDDEFTARLDALDHAPKGSVIALPLYSIGRSRWVIGDDFAIRSSRERRAREWGLARIDVSGRQPTAAESGDER